MHFTAQHPDGRVFLSTDPALLDIDAVHGFLTTSYWSTGIPRETVARAAANSLAFGLYEGAAPARLIGFGRLITDRATFAYLSDVFVLDAHRGRGLGVWMVRTVLTHPDLKGLRRICLLTRDAQTLYAKLGFKPMPDPTRYMEVHDPDAYSPSRG